jgi:hypothetical protein
MGMQHKFDVAKLQHDMDLRGWLPTDLARASGLSSKTVYLCLGAERFNARTWARLAGAMGYSVRRYLAPIKKVA